MIRPQGGSVFDLMRQSMSLFENDEYQWRETYFILFREPQQLTAARMEQELKQIDPRYIVRDVRASESGGLESVTVEAPDDYSAMDISLVRGEEVDEQTHELVKELLRNATSAREKEQIRQLKQYHCRYDVYHFEQLVFVGREDEDGDGEGDDFMDPGAVLTVMQKIAELCDGIVVDPQTYTIL
jgi:hypothetical protein